MTIRNCFFLLVAPVIFYVLHSQAMDTFPVDSKSPEKVIRAQLEAFQVGDLSTAYELASPAIKQHFPNVDTFGEMVRIGYKPIYSPQSMQFMPFMENHKPPLQHVIVVGPEGRAWDAYYIMMNNDEGEWRVAGVRLYPRDEFAI